MTKRWLSPPPMNCDLCGNEITGKFYDARIPRHRMFGCVCSGCFALEGCSLGTGRGQEYTLKNGIWEKTGG